MPVDVSWYKNYENKIAYSRFYGDITLEDVQNEFIHYQNFVENLDTPVAQIVDSREVTGYPLKLGLFKEIIQHHKINQTQGFVVIVGVSGIAHFLVSILTQMIKREYRLADTLEEAEAIIHRVIEI
ncbi:MAG: hypothetical protein ACPG7F_12420 [Aggregatilineales bacterium]